jgi:hypothetical protein
MGHLNSFTVTDGKGKHYLLKGSGYKNNAAAIDAWRKGDNPELGVFDSEKEATNASKQMSEDSDHNEPTLRRELGPLSYNVNNMSYNMDRAYDFYFGPDGAKLREFTENFIGGAGKLKLIKGLGKPGSAETLLRRGNLSDVNRVLSNFVDDISNIQTAKAPGTDAASAKQFFRKAFDIFNTYMNKYEKQIPSTEFTRVITKEARRLEIKPGPDRKIDLKGLIPASMVDPYYGSNEGIFNNDKLASRAIARDLYNKSQSNKYVTTEALLRSYGDPSKLGKQMAIYTGIDAFKNKTGMSSTLPVHNPTQLGIMTSGLINALTDSETYNTVYRSLFTNPIQNHDIGYWGSKKLINQPTADKLPDVPTTEYLPKAMQDIAEGYKEHGNLLNETIKKTSFVTDQLKPKETPNPDVIKNLVNTLRR